MTHLGQRLSALIDGELEGSERERVLWHVSRCVSCRDEVAALHTLKRKIGALGDAAAGAGLTVRLIRLSALGRLADPQAADTVSADTRPPAPAWPDRQNDLPSRGPASAEQRAGRYFLTGSLVIFLAGLGTAAFIAGGEPQPQAPTPPVAPSVDVMMFPHGAGGGVGTGPPIVRPSRPRTQSVPAASHTSHIRT